jgi:glycosyltransferase involved in cell wall biosynthesis
MEFFLFPPFYFYEGGRFTSLQKINSSLYNLKPLWPVFPYKPYLYFLIGLKKELIKLSPDLILIWEEPLSFVSYLVSLWKKKDLLKSQLLLFSAENIERRYPFPFSYFYQKTLATATGVITVNKGAKNIISQKISVEKVFELPLGISQILFQTESFPYRRYVKRREANKLVFLFVGRLNEQKNPLQFLEIASRFPHSEIIIVGNGKLKQQLLYRLKRDFFGRFLYLSEVDLNQMPLLYKQSDFLVLPYKETSTKREQFSRIVIEAMASGVIPVYSQDGDMKIFFGEEFCYGEYSDIYAAIKKIKFYLHNTKEVKNIFTVMKKLVQEYSNLFIAQKERKIINKFL